MCIHGIQKHSAERTEFKKILIDFVKPTLSYHKVILPQNAWHILLIIPKLRKRVLSDITIRTGKLTTQTRQQIWRQLSLPLQTDLRYTGLGSLEPTAYIHL